MEKSQEAQDREMLEHMHICFMRGPGMPRSWEEMPEKSRESLRKLYREAVERHSKAAS